LRLNFKKFSKNLVAGSFKTRSGWKKEKNPHKYVPVLVMPLLFDKASVADPDPVLLV
jgi:hypothetical protein